MFVELFIVGAVSFLVGALASWAMRRLLDGYDVARALERGDDDVR